MGKTPRTYSQMMQDQVSEKPGYAGALLEEAMRCFLRGETSIARSHVRDVIKGTIGYGELARRTGTPETSLIRMFGPTGNPTFENVSSVLTQLQTAGGVELRVNSVPVRRKRVSKRPTASSLAKSGTASAQTHQRPGHTRQSAAPTKPY